MESSGYTSHQGKLERHPPPQLDPLISGIGQINCNVQIRHPESIPGVGYFLNQWRPWIFFRWHTLLEFQFFSMLVLIKIANFF
jgi:hypothetical protein